MKAFGIAALGCIACSALVTSSVAEAATMNRMEIPNGFQYGFTYESSRP